MKLTFSYNLNVLFIARASLQFTITIQGKSKKACLFKPKFLLQIRNRSKDFPKKTERPSKSESNNQQKHKLLQKHPERQQQCILNYIKLKGSWYSFVCVSAVSCLLLHISEQCMWQFTVSRRKHDLVQYGQCNTLNSIRSNVHRVTKFLRFN